MSEPSENPRRTAPPDYFSPSVQRRLLTMTCLLLLVLGLAQYAARPASWAWMWGRTQPTSVPAAVAVEAWDRWHPSLDPSLLGSIEDDTHFRPAESNVWSHLLAILHNSTTDQLQHYSLGPTSYLQLDQQTNEYRGRLVQVHGTLRRAHRLPAAPNDAGVTHYWQCWLFPKDGPMRPIVVYVLDWDDQLPRGMTVEVAVEVTGFVFKRWMFQSAEELTVAPVLLAKRFSMESVTDQPLSTSQPSSRVSQHLPMILTLTGLTAVVATACLFRWTSRSMRRRRASVLSEADVVLPDEMTAVSTTAPKLGEKERPT